MKIADVRKQIKAYGKIELELLVAELYKAIPKANREAYAIDELIANPQALKKSTAPRKKKEAPLPCLDEVLFDVDEFVIDAYAQNYFAPNRVVSKSKRSKWRFQVRRWHKDLMQIAATDPAAVPEAAAALVELYKVLCRACGEYLFSTDVPFQSVGITQDAFFNDILTLNHAYMTQDKFISDALMIMSKNAESHDIRSTDLVRVIIRFLSTPDSLEACISMSEAFIRKKITPSLIKNEFRREHAVNTLVELAINCFGLLGETAKGVAFLKKYGRPVDKKMHLVKLLNFLFEMKDSELYIHEYEDAIKHKIKPHDCCTIVYEHVVKTGTFPDSFYL